MKAAIYCTVSAINRIYDNRIGEMRRRVMIALF